MRKIIMSIFVSAAVTYGTASFAQGHGEGHIPAPSGGPQSEHGNGGNHQAEAKTDPNFESRIESNPQLKSRVDSLLPSGMDLKTAAMGFRNQGQFIAALHISKNLNIPFDQLKAKMTGNPPLSLGKAIQALRPNVTEKDAKADAEKAEKQAKATENDKPLT